MRGARQHLSARQRELASPFHCPTATWTTSGERKSRTAAVLRGDERSPGPVLRTTARKAGSHRSRRGLHEGRTNTGVLDDSRSDPSAKLDNAAPFPAGSSCPWQGRVTRRGTEREAHRPRRLDSRKRSTCVHRESLRSADPQALTPERSHLRRLRGNPVRRHTASYRESLGRRALRARGGRRGGRGGQRGGRDGRRRSGRRRLPPKGESHGCRGKH